MKLKIKLPLVKKIVLLFLLFILFFILISFNQNLAMYRKIKELKAQGFRITPEEFFTKCKDEDNALFVWEEIKNSIKIDKTEVDSWQIRRDIHFEKWDAVPKEHKNTLRKFLNSNTNVLPLLQKAVSLPCLTINPDFSKPMIKWTYPKFPAPDNIQLFIYPRGMLALDDGDVKSAKECCLLGFKIFNRFSKSTTYGLWESYPTRNYDDSIRLLIEIIKSGNADKSFLTEVFKMLDPEIFRTYCYNRYDFYRVMELNALYHYKNGNLNIKELEDYLFEYPNIIHKITRRFIYPKVVFQRQDYMIFNLINLKKDPIIYRKWINESVAKFENSDDYFFLKYFRRSSNSDFNIIRSNLYDFTRLNIARLAVACKLYTMEHEKIPNSLDDLVPKYFEKLPIDIYSGKPYVYKILNNDGFVIYSLGENGKDDIGNNKDIDAFIKIIDAKDNPCDDFFWIGTPEGYLFEYDSFRNMGWV